jgi:hypothetical protein
MVESLAQATPASTLLVSAEELNRRPATSNATGSRPQMPRQKAEGRRGPGLPRASVMGARKRRRFLAIRHEKGGLVRAEGVEPPTPAV